MNENILIELRKPFHPTQITWKPGMISKDQNKALALAYADLRAYQNRLDELCGMGWSVSYTPWGDRIVCHVTINGVTRSSSGESDNQSERSEIGGTSAEAQAFKRACAMFGLGRYLYNLPSVWVEYDPSTKQFTDKAKAKLEGLIIQHYNRTMNESSSTQQTTEQKAEVSEDLRKAFDDAGTALYGDEWTKVCKHNAERITGNQGADASALTAEQIQKLLEGMKALQKKRQHTNGATVGK